MKLYLVTCVYKGSYSTDELGVYVVAENPAAAERIALALMKKLSYKYNNFVSRVELLASEDPYQAGSLLVIAK